MTGEREENLLELYALEMLKVEVTNIYSAWILSGNTHGHLSKYHQSQIFTYTVAIVSREILIYHKQDDNTLIIPIKT